MADSIRVNEKYTILGLESGRLRAERNNSEWRDLIGDKLVLALAQELEAARESNVTLAEAADEARSDAAWMIDGERMGR